ncbi:MAG: rod shape-determining protein MreD [Candidatus Marinimicrobia bacterium]|nr:rod shape-determining protein MreD [Candidatus Neomarinimicrobiota bacterium]
MARKILLYIGIALVLLTIQGLIGPWMTIQKIRPDFLLILVLYIGQKEGKIFGQLAGFIIGLTMDLIGMSTFLGLSAFVMTLSGFLAGFFKNQRNKINIFSYYFSILLICLIHFFILYSIYYHSLGLSIQYRMVRYVVPSLIYTGIFYFLIEFVFSKQIE